MRSILLLAAFFFVAISLVKAQSSASQQDETEAMSVEVVQLFKASRFAEAKEKAKQVISIRESRLGKKHLGLVSAWRNLAYIEVALKDLDGAETAFDRTLDLLESNQPLTSANELILAEILEAAAYFDIGNRTLGKSEARLRRSLEIRERLEGDRSKRLAGPLRTLGQLHHGRGEYDKAVPFLTRALDLKYESAGTLLDEDLTLRETAICSLRKVDRTSEADEIGRRFRSSTVGGPGIPKDGTISGGVVNGKALELARPAYPREARANNDSGTVSVKVLINEAGKVVFACAVSGPKTLQMTSENAAYQSKFSPTRLKGEPVKVSGVITYNFKL